MKKKLWFAAILIVVGILVSAIAMALVGFDVFKLNTMKLVDTSETIDGSFTDIQIDTDTCDIEFRIADNGICRFEGKTLEKMPITAKVENNVLIIKQDNHRQWYDYVGIFFWNNCQITVYLPETAYNQLTVNGDTADIKIGNAFSFETISISVSTGDIYCSAAVNSMTAKASTGDIVLADIYAEGDISLKTSTGDITLKNVICKDLFAKLDTGDMKLVDCDAQSLVIKTSTGDVTGTLLTEKSFFTFTSTGDIHVPESYSGGPCKIKTSTGDIRISFQ